MPTEQSSSAYFIPNGDHVANSSAGDYLASATPHRVDQANLKVLREHLNVASALGAKSEVGAHPKFDRIQQRELAHKIRGRPRGIGAIKTRDNRVIGR